MSFEAIRRLGSLGTLNQLSPPISVDFGVSALKVLQIAKGDPPSLVSAAFIPTPEELQSDPLARLDFQSDALARVVRTGGFKGKRAVCALPSFMTTCKHVRVAKGDPASVNAQVASTLAQQINAAPGSLVLRTVDVGEVERVGATGGKQSEVICIAAHRDGVRRLMDAIKLARLEPVGMHSEFAATLKAFGDLAKAPVGGGERTTLYLDIGRGSTRVLIAHEDTMVFARVLPLGGRALDEAIVSSRNMTIEEARRARYAHAGDMPERGRIAEPGVNSRARASGAIGDDSLDEPTGLTGHVACATLAPCGPDEPALNEAIEILTDEVLMCLRYHESLFPTRKVSAVVFMGGESRHAGLCQHLARSLKLPAQVADPLARIARSGKEPATGVNMKEAQPGWTVALGLCLSPTDL